MSKLIRLTGLWKRKDGSLSGGPLRELLPGARLIIQPVRDRSSKDPHFVAYLSPEGEEGSEQLRLEFPEEPGQEEKALEVVRLLGGDGSSDQSQAQQTELF